ncbi:MAG: hypothetical protein ACXWCZ_03470 [Flavisolibacter sp.]
MERDFYTDEFEDLIKLKADQYRMYPSDKVWKGIKRSLHSNRRKYWFGFALLLTGLSYFGIDQLIVSPPAKQVTNPTPNASTEKQDAKIIPFNQVPPGGLIATQPTLPITTSQIPAIAPSFALNKNNPAPAELTAITPIVVSNLETSTANKNISHPVENIATKDDIITVKEMQIVRIDKLSGFIIIPREYKKEREYQAEDDIQRINWLQEYAVYNLSPSRPKRINWQLSFAPTMNYRKLTGRKNASMQSNSRNIPIALNIEGDLDKLVNHKPALGFELGSYLLFNVNHNFALKAGFQFNYSRYEIQAYSSGTERATISLNSINGLTSSSISNYTQLRNFGGYAVQDLQNQYFQLSVPVGIELNILGDSKLQLGVAGTVQPTYLLNRNSYLISSDYKNYTKEPSLVRRWNVNTSAETFVSYKTAGLKWQVGPQIRYQLFSSYTDKYPIKEYLIEYGVKIGVTKTIR